MTSVAVFILVVVWGAAAVGVLGLVSLLGNRLSIENNLEQSSIVDLALGLLIIASLSVTPFIVLILVKVN